VNEEVGRAEQGRTQLVFGALSSFCRALNFLSFLPADPTQKHVAADFSFHAIQLPGSCGNFQKKIKKKKQEKIIRQMR
jgi:hypothetical protein